MPATALALLLLVAVWPRFQAAIDSVHFTSLPKIDTSQAQDVRMVAARYSGLDRENRPFVVTAEVAHQAPKADDAIALDGPKADMTTLSGNWNELTAYVGLYQPQSQLLDLFGNVELYQDKGNEIHSDSVRIDMAQGTAESHDPVDGQGHFRPRQRPGPAYPEPRRHHHFHWPCHPRPRAPCGPDGQGHSMKSRSKGVAACAALAALAALALGGPSARAQNGAGAPGLAGSALGSNNQPIHIVAEQGIEWQQTNRLYIARGHATATRGDDLGPRRHALRLLPPGHRPEDAGRRNPRCAATSDGGPDTLTERHVHRDLPARGGGNVRFVNATQTAYGDHAVYDVDQAVMVLTGKNLRMMTAATKS